MDGSPATGAVPSPGGARRLHFSPTICQRRHGCPAFPSYRLDRLRARSKHIANRVASPDPTISHPPYVLPRALLPLVGHELGPVLPAKQSLPEGFWLCGIAVARPPPYP